MRRLTAEGTVGEATRVSTNGGSEPRWSRDGRDLFFLTTPQGFSSAQMKAVAAQAAGPALEFGAPAPLFKVRMLPVQQVTRDYDLSLDGRRFLVGMVVGEPKGTPIAVVLNRMEDLKK